MWKVLQLQGQRQYMEDRFIANEGFFEDYDLYCVFDGHGGNVVADYCRENYAKFLYNELVESQGDIGKSLYLSFLKIDNAIPITDSFVTGSTCLVVLKNTRTVWVANCGDSRAIISTQDKCMPLSEDHKPAEKEKERIEKLGGSVVQTEGGVWRVQGSLAMSRAIGDKHLRPFVIPQPEIYKIDINSKFKFILLATDGLWDILSNLEVSKIILSVYDNPNLSDNEVLVHANHKLLEHIYNKIEDNTTAILVHIRR